LAAQTLTGLSLHRFTVFERLDLKFTPGINVIIGRNATGKTHLLKVLYTATRALAAEGETFGEKLVRVFGPSEGRPGRLVKRTVGRSSASIEVVAGTERLRAGLSTQMERGSKVRTEPSGGWFGLGWTSVYIPVKEMLAHAPGFRSLYSKREIAFDEVYKDLVDSAYLPVLRGKRDTARKRLLQQLEGLIDGKVETDGEAFFLRDKQGNLEFNLLAEGLRKLALLWLLIQNGTLGEGNILFWDEPEANLNPSLQGNIVEILLELQRSGVQVFLATHNYVLLKEFDLRMNRDDKVLFHSLDRQESTGEVTSHTAKNYLDIGANVIQDTYLDLYDREVRRALGGNK
jgi:energy-coupling factor transporter ATP-binding protein EcfA2